MIKTKLEELESIVKEKQELEESKPYAIIVGGITSLLSTGYIVTNGEPKDSAFESGFGLVIFGLTYYISKHGLTGIKYLLDYYKR